MKKNKVMVENILMYLLITVTWAVAFGGWFSLCWKAPPMVQRKGMERTSHIVRVYESDVESLVYGYDSKTDFTPGIYTGGLVISPEDDYYNSVELMAKVIEAEAGNQNLLGKRMVADVILNRVRDEDFPDTIVDVIFQENAFSVINNGMYEQVEVSEETWSAVWMELKEVSYPGLFYFCSAGFPEYGTPWDKIGDHYFNTK